MPAPVDIRRDFTPDQLRDIADTLDDRQHARRLRAIAAVLEGKSRSEAASIGGMERQTLRDWVHRFNAAGPSGLKSLRSPGRPPKLDAAQRADLVELIADPASCGLHRWRLSDLVFAIRDRFGVEHDEVSVGRILKGLGYYYNGVEWRKVAKPGDSDPGNEPHPVRSADMREQHAVWNR